MDLSNVQIGPTQGAAPVAPQQPAQAPANDIASLPPIKAVLEGKPGAIYAPTGYNSPLSQIIGKSFKDIANLGLAFYHSPNGRMILFNPAVLPPKELKAADDAGKIDSVAAPITEFDTTAPQAPQENDAAAPAPGGAQPLTKGLTPRAQSKLAGSRIKSLMDTEEPTARPVPGGGRILNSLLTRAS